MNAGWRRDRRQVKAGHVRYMNLPWIEALRALARERGASVAQIAIAWVMSRGEDIVPLVGSRSRDRHAEAIGAVPLRLTAGELARIGQAIPPDAAAGERYPSAILAHADNQRSDPNPT